MFLAPAPGRLFLLPPSADAYQKQCAEREQNPLRVAQAGKGSFRVLGMSQSTRAAVTKCHRPGGLTTDISQFQRLEIVDWRSGITRLWGLPSGLLMATFLLCPHMAENELALLKAPPPHAITLGLGLEPRNLGNTNISPFNP